MKCTIKKITIFPLTFLLVLSWLLATLAKQTVWAQQHYLAACEVMCFGADFILDINLNAKNCDGESKDVNIDQRGGRYRCYTPAPQPMPEDQCFSIGEGDTKAACHRYLSCGESDDPNNGVSGSPYNKEFDVVEYPREHNFFEPDTIDRYAGANGFRCGKYNKVSPPWWQVTQGNIYASSDIRYQELPADTDCSSRNNFVLAKNLVTDYGSMVGLQMSEGNIFLTSEPEYRTQRDQPDTTVAPANFDDNSQLKQDYEYFKSLLSFDQIETCGPDTYSEVSTTDDPSESSRVCKTPTATMSTPFDADTLVNDVVGGVDSVTGISTVYVYEKVVIFVDGDLLIDSSIHVDLGGFLAFIVSGDIIFDQNFGNEIYEPYSGQSASGVYIADGNITFPSRVTNITAELAPFNDKPYCDKQAVLEGTFVSVSGKIELTRTFRACHLIDGIDEFIDYNCANPATRIIYRPDFLTSMPTWMKESRIVRTEVI